MNVELLLKAKAAMLAHPEEVDMLAYFHPCKTPSCIAGHVIAEAGGVPVDTDGSEAEAGFYYAKLPGDDDLNDVHSMAAKLLGVSHDEASALFEPMDWGGCGEPSSHRSRSSPRARKHAVAKASPHPPRRPSPTRITTAAGCGG